MYILRHCRSRLLATHKKKKRNRISADGTRILSKVRKSVHDIRDYKAIKLANGLVALLVHDPLVSSAKGKGKSEQEEGGRKRMSAAAMSVGVGNLQSPKEVQGIAHMLEHMLTMGSKEFQLEEDYKGFISEHGGDHDEGTDAGLACYSFQVNGEHLKEALQRFSHCFISPLLRKNTLEREIQALDQEFYEGKDECENLLERLRCHTSKANHSYNKFLPGNLKSLMNKRADDPRPVKTKRADYTRLQKQILAFYRKHYRARNLKLVVISGEPLSVLVNWVKELFSSIRKGPAQKTSILKPIQAGLHSQKRKLPNKAIKLPKLYQKQESMKPIWKPGKMYRVESKTSGHILEVIWTFPCLRKLYRKKPEEYMSHFLEHEGKGSLFSLLKAREWATSLTAGVWDHGIYRTSDAYVFVLTIHLTDIGLNKILDIIGFVYQYLEVLRDSTPKRLFKEVKLIGKMEFDFGDEKIQREYAAKLSENLLFSSPKHVIGADYVVNKWDKRLIRKLLRYFAPENMRVDIVSNSFELEDPKSEPWSGINYLVEDIDEGLMKKWAESSENDTSFALPSNNRFITRKFELCAEDTRDVPACIIDEDGLKFWYKKDDTFKVPHAHIYLRINFKGACLDVKSSALTEFFIHLLKDELSEVISEAEVAKLEMLIAFVDGMFELKVSGFNEKLPLLLSEVLPKVNSFMPTEERFQLMKKDIKKSLMNQATLLLKTLLCEHSYENKEKLLYLDGGLSLCALKEFIENLRSELYIEGLCHGNLTEKEARDIGDMIRNSFPGNPLPDMSRHVEHVVCLPHNANLVMDFYASKMDEIISVAELYFQFKQDLELASTKWMALFDLFCDIVQEYFFDRLRTDEQLGYDVNCYPLVVQCVFGFCFHIKSSSYDPQHLQERIDELIKGLDGFFQNFSDKSFNNYKTSLADKLMQKASSLKGESERLWTEIIEQRSKFDIEIKKAEELKKINKKDMIKWCGKYLKESSHHCRRLKVRHWDANTDMEADDSESEFDRIEDFKKGYEFYPGRVDD